MGIHQGADFQAHVRWRRMNAIRLLAIIWWTVGCAFAALAQTAMPDSKPDDRSPGPALLREAHALVTRLPPEEGVQVLSGAAHAAGVLNLPETRSWARELFDLAAKLNKAPTFGTLPAGLEEKRAAFTRYAIEQQRQTVREAAAGAMAKPDPEAALAMLPGAKAPSVPEGVGLMGGGVGGGGGGLEGGVAGAVFSAYFVQKGVAGLPRLQTTALEMAQGDGYPYSAWTGILGKLSATAPAEARAVAVQALAAYDQHRPQAVFPFQDDFLRFLQACSPSLSAAERRAALQSFVKHVPGKEPVAGSGSYHVAAGGGTAGFTNRGDAILYRYLRQIRALDGEFAEELVKSRPELAAAPPLGTGSPRSGAMAGGTFVAGTGGVSGTGEVSGEVAARFNTTVTTGERPPAQSSAGNPAPATPATENQAPQMPADWLRYRESNRVLMLAQTDRAAALAAADSLTDEGARAWVYARLAGGLGAKNRDAAIELLGKAKQLAAGLTDPGAQLDTQAAIAQTALLLQEYETFDATFPQVLSLQSRLADRPRMGPGEDRYLIWNAMRVRPAATLAAIRELADLKLRGRLLVESALAASKVRVSESRSGGITMLMYDSRARAGGGPGEARGE